MPVIRLAASLLLVSLFCGASAHAQVDPANPVSSTPSLLSITPLPNATGPLFQATPQQTDPNSVHEGVFTWGLNLLQPPTPDFVAWQDSHDPSKGNGLEFTASPAFEFHLDSAMLAGSEKLGQADPGSLASIFSAFAEAVNLIPGAHAEVVSLPEMPVTSFFGYAPVRARWLRSQWVPAGPILIAPPYQVYKQFVYSDYRAFGDIRLRGARFPEPCAENADPPDGAPPSSSETSESTNLAMTSGTSIGASSRASNGWCSGSLSKKKT